jgi:hypothetical protein
MSKVIIIIDKLEELVQPIAIVWSSGTVQEWKYFAVAYGLEEVYDDIDELFNDVKKVLEREGVSNVEVQIEELH